MKIQALLLGVLLSAAVSLVSEAANLDNIPRTLVQPDGDTVHCFLSGDEFYHRFHDNNGYTIVKDQHSGYWVYADLMLGKVVPTSNIVGRIDPVGLSLQPNIMISADEYSQIFDRFFAGKDVILTPNTGIINNICIFLRFSGEAEFPDPRSYYDSLFNYSVSNVSSLQNYFYEVSYNQLTINTEFFPICGLNENLSYEDTHPRAYYQEYDPVDNPIGYVDEDDRRVREHSLLRSAINFISFEIPIDLEIDNDFDGFVDAVCFVVSDTADGGGDLLWPHRWSLYTYDVFIRGVQVYGYAFELEEMSTVDVYCHETFHVLGSPDLYHYYYPYKDLHPIAQWGLMDTHPDPPTHIGAYMKYQYGGWIDSIPRIVVPGTYSLNPITSESNNAYLIPSPTSDSEYFVVEYRKQSNNGVFENSLPGTGLLIYRINSNWVGYGNRYGPPDEVYIYRPGGELLRNGNPSTAHFSQGDGRTAFNESTDPNCWQSDSTLGGLSISNIGSAGNTISFQLDANEHFLSGDVYDGQFGPLTPEGESYFIASEVIVPSGQTLTINPGTRVYFFEGGKITANGVFTANGSTEAIEFIMYEDSTVTTRIISGFKLQNGGSFGIP